MLGVDGKLSTEADRPVPAVEEALKGPDIDGRRSISIVETLCKELSTRWEFHDLPRSCSVSTRTDEELCRSEDAGGP